jgi:transposase-like protein
MKSLSCANKNCPLAGKPLPEESFRHGFYGTKWGRRRRYRCQACGKTFCTNTGTPYHRLQHRRATFDEVAALSVEGLNKSAIARVKQIAWNTVDRWLERAADSCHRFNARRITGLAVEELQADEIRTIVGGKQQPIWIFVSIDVCSRLWPSTVVGRRSYRNTLTLFLRCSQADGFCTLPNDRHGRIRVLRKSRAAGLWASVSLRPGDQNAQERSCGQREAKNQDRCRLAVGAGVG